MKPRLLSPVEGNPKKGFHELIRCVVFDLDGTLIDVGDLFYRLFDKVIRTAGLDAIDFRKAGDPWVSAHAQTMARYPALHRAPSEPSFADAWETVLRELLREDGVRLYAGARDLLHGLRASGRKICLATNTPKRFVEIKLDHFELRGFFNLVFTPQDRWGAKPRPDSLLHVIEQFGFSPDEVVMVGDHDQDILYGRNAGVGTIGVINQYNTRGELASAQADRIVSSLDELMSTATKTEGAASWE